MSDEKPVAVTVEGLRRRYSENDRDFSGMCLDGMDLSSGSANFSGANFEGTSFRGANLSTARLEGCNLKGCDFTGAKLEHVVMRHTDLRGAKFDGVKFVNLDMLDARLTGASFAGASIEPGQLGAIDAEAVCFAKSNLTGCDFTMARLAKADFRGAVIHTGQFKKADLTDANFEDASIRDARFENATLQGVKLARVPVMRSVFSGVNLTSTALHGANVGATKFLDVRLDGVDLRGLKVDNLTQFTSCTVVATTIERTTLERLDDNGGLTRGQLQDMHVIDGLTDLRASYSGFWQWLHLIALVVFVWPYLVHLVPLSFRAQPVCVGDCVTVFESLRIYISTGGKMGHEYDWLMVFIFWFSLSYNFLRFILLAKTKTLELQVVAAGFSPKFSLEDPVWKFQRRHRALRWKHLLSVAKLGLLVNVALVLYHLLHFMQMYVNVQS